MRARLTFLAAALGVLGAACAAILGFEDPALAPTADGGGSPDGGGRGDGSTSGGPGDGGGDGAPSSSTPCDGACTPVPIGGTFSFPAGIALDDDAVYVGEAAAVTSEIWRVPKMGGPAAALTNDNAGGSVRRLVVVMGQIYWTSFDSDKVYSCPTTGCPLVGPKVEASTDGTPLGLVVVGNRLVWADYESGELGFQTLGAGAAENVDVGWPAREVAASGPWVYATTTGSEVVSYRIDDAGAGPVVGTSKPPTGIVVVNGTVYFGMTSSGGLGAFPVNATSASTPTVFGAPTKSAYGLASDGQYLYWTDEGNELPSGSFAPGSSCIWRCRLDQCTTTPPSSLVCGLNDAVGIAVDATGIYWVETGTGTLGTGALKRLPKP
jgi:hypothetical protein